jgi:branched-chain amino acid transport system substrate-binding protein
MQESSEEGKGSSSFKKSKREGNDMKKLFFKLGWVVAGILVLLGVSSEGLAKEEILMGYSASVTGSYSHVGKMTKDGYTAWADMVNRKGGIFVKDLNKKLKVRLVMYDDKSDPSTAAKLYEKLITDDKVDLVLSPWGSSIGFPVSGICQKYKMPIVYVWVSSDPIFKQGYDYSFCLIQPASQHEWSPLDLLKTANIANPPKKIMYISIKELYGKTTATGGFNRAKELGLEPYYEEVEKGCKDFTPLVTKMKSLGIEAISTGIYEAEFFLLFKQMQELNFYPKFIFASHGTDLPDFWEMFGKIGEGACAGGFYHTKWKTFENEEFVASYQKIAGTFPTHYGATAAGGQIIQQAIEKAGTLDRERIKKVLQEEEFKCLLYPRVKFITEGGYTNLNKFAFTGVLQWQDGKLMTIYPTSLAEGKFVYPMPFKGR